MVIAFCTDISLKLPFGYKKPKGTLMSEYMERLERCGISAYDACQIIRAMLKDYDIDALEELTASIEVECYVD